MSMDCICKLQHELYRLLHASELINTTIKQIYFSVPQDGVYPFLLIEINNLRNMSRNSNAIYSIEFSIGIFGKNNFGPNLMELAEEVRTITTLSDHPFDEYVLSASNMTNISLKQANDLVSTKMMMNYQGLLKKIKI